MTELFDIAESYQNALKANRKFKRLTGNLVTSATLEIFSQEYPANNYRAALPEMRNQAICLSWIAEFLSILASYQECGRMVPPDIIWPISDK